MAMKTGGCCLALFFFVLPLHGQGSPLQWPVPPPGPPRETVFPRILMSAGELARTLEEAAGRTVPVDLRGEAAYAAGHVPGAVPAGNGSMITGGEATLVLYGEDREEIARQLWLLRRAGVSEVRILDGGIAAWQAAGGKMERGLPHPPPARLRQPSGNLEATVDAGEVARVYGRPGFELLDVRDARGWDRWQTPPTFAAGHIPYAFPFDPRALLPEGGGWPDPAALRRRLGEIGPRPGDPVRLEDTFLLYGEDERDPRASLAWLLLTLAGLEARVLPGGYAEWTAGGGRPVVRVISAADLAARLRAENPGLVRDAACPSLILLDLREERDFKLDHLPGARSLPFLYFPDRFEKTVAGEWPGADRATTPLVFYCYGIDCVRSRKASAEAARLGFRNILWFRGGVREWRDAGYPFFSSRPPTSSPSPSPYPSQ